eukprot:3333036-Prymnesium_polylepis.3
MVALTISKCRQRWSSWRRSVRSRALTSDQRVRAIFRSCVRIPLRSQASAVLMPVSWSPTMSAAVRAAKSRGAKCTKRAA